MSSKLLHTSASVHSRNLAHDSATAMSDINTDFNTDRSTGEQFAPWQYLNTINAEEHVLNDLPLLNHNERAIALQSAIHAAYLDVSASGKYTHAIHTLERESGSNPYKMFEKLQQVFTINHHGSLETDIAHNEYNAFEAQRSITPSAQFDRVKNDLASRSTEQHLSEQGKIENALRQIDEGTLSWEQVGVHGASGREFPHTL